MRDGGIEAVIAAQPPGRALERDFYMREDIFERDLDLLLGRWTCAGHASQLAEPGAWMTLELGSESMIIVRGEDGELRALANVCRHRGSRICLGEGRSVRFTCPYHAWTYDLAGALVAAREQPEGFRTEDHGLRQLPLAVVGGMVLVSFAPDPPHLFPAADGLARLASLYGWEAARVAERRTYPIAANWKLAMENYHECYHCAPAHPEFSALHTLARPKGRRSGEEAAWVKTLAREGLEAGGIEHWESDAQEGELGRFIPSTLARGAVSGSRTGSALAPPMGPAGRHAGGCGFAELGFLSAFLAYPDHGLIYRFAPVSARETRLDVIWLVDGAAQEGRDYDLAELVWLWDVTSVADKRIIEMNQAGVASRAYAPGPFSPMERGTSLYVQRYLAELRAVCAR